jgi:hypothetical protein
MIHFLNLPGSGFGSHHAIVKYSGGVTLSYPSSYSFSPVVNLFNEILAIIPDKKEEENRYVYISPPPEEIQDYKIKFFEIFTCITPLPRELVQIIWFYYYYNAKYLFAGLPLSS